MKPKLTIGVLFFLWTSSSFAQKATEDFEIMIPKEKVGGSYYNSLRLIDTRENPDHLGIVQLGAFNRKAKVVPKEPLSYQLNNVMNALIDGSATNGGLLMIMKHFSFAEITGAFSEKGYFHFRAVLLEGDDETGYRKLASIDTVVVVQTMDVTRALFRKGSKLIIDFIAANLRAVSVDSLVLSYAQAVSIDSIEKRSLILYNTAELKNGLYKTYTSFAGQIPDQENFEVEFSGNKKIKSLKMMDKAGKLKKIEPEGIYAFIHDGVTYIATEYGYYPLQKKGDDFYFTGKAKVTADAGKVMAAGLFFGITGSLIASSPTQADFEMKIDHVSGGFIRLKEVKKEKMNR